jgi:WD40 repeat protein
MNARSDFDPIVASWLDAQAGRGAPDYLDEVLAVTTRTRQRPAWSSLERWLPVDLTLSQRIRPIPNLARAVAIAAILALIVAGLLVVAAGQRHVPHFGAQANGALTYVDGATIKLASADGKTIRAGAAIPAGSQSLTFSPDATRLAYRTTGTLPSIVVADADGSRASVITGGLAAASSAQVSVHAPFAFSPDGRRIVFTAQDSAGLRSLRLVNVDGSNIVALAPAGAAATDEWFDPAWSADGQWIAFFWHHMPADLTEIYLAHPDGSGGHLLKAAAPDPCNLELAWSPDPAQSLLAYVQGGDCSGGSIAIQNVATTKEVFAGSGLWITWSPDGKQLAYWGGDTRVAQVAGVIAGRSQTISLFPSMPGATCAGHPDLVGKAICGPAQWSPDSTLVYGTDVSGTTILIKHADGSGPLLQIPLDHPVDITNGPNGSLAWQAVSP